eukprot:gb/GECG01000302.1/.p1 GENE.gb/GECG01000302.1/~~gb/GECG01000302.1/.p1  ORF type:complete len:337 (+),score=35.73 gb/GECG01000302.1/:1-1011(+)
MGDSTEYAISLDSVEDAHRTIQSVIHKTPLLTSESMNEFAEGTQVFFKVEALQKTGSFKIRGATNAIMKLPSDVKDKGVVTHSSGNHGQAVARAARARNVPAYICMPRTAPQVKIDAVRGYGAQITFCEPTDASRVETAKRVQAETGAYFVHPSNDPHVMSGQGTVGLELLEQVGESTNGGAPLDAIIVPIGGGGLISGIATAVKARYPSIQIIGAEPANADDAYRSKIHNRIMDHETPPQTVADGLKTILGSNTWPIVRDSVDDIVLVSEEDIISATRLVWQRMKICIEPSSGTGVAAVLSNRIKEMSLRKVAVVLCGGNVDIDRPLPWMNTDVA